MRRLTRRSFSLALLAALAGGCGGGGLGFDNEIRGARGSGGMGGVTVRVVWPHAVSTRVVPAAAQSVRVEILRSGVTVASALLVTPATAATLTEIPTGAVVVRATAYANAAGTGVALATADAAATVSDGATTPVTVPMASTVQSVQVAPASVTIVLSILSYRQLTVTAKDVGGTTVPIAASDLEFTSDAPLKAIVTSTGLVTGLIPGNATVTVREKTSGKTFAVPVTVVL